jgi:hypothetical protein
MIAPRFDSSTRKAASPSILISTARAFKSVPPPPTPPRLLPPFPTWAAAVVVAVPIPIVHRTRTTPILPIRILIFTLTPMPLYLVLSIIIRGQLGSGDTAFIIHMDSHTLPRAYRDIRIISMHLRTEWPWVPLYLCPISIKCKCHCHCNCQIIDRFLIQCCCRMASTTQILT